MPFYRLALLVVAVGLLASSGAQAATTVLDAEAIYTFSTNLARVLSRNWWQIF